MKKDLFQEQRITKDPVYGSMVFDKAEKEFLKPFIDHPLFQRLRHIKQLSLVDYVFPGAVHTRFNHSLGCCYLASKIYKTLNPDNNNFLKNHALHCHHKLILLAGLLHDIGHGPFSHTFEKIDALRNKSFTHEEWFQWFCKEIFADIKNHDLAFYNKYELAKLQYKLIELFNSINQDKDASNFQPPWIQQLVSSQIDVDRMDYLLRDSHFCGVNYGLYDLEWLISCLYIHNDEIVISDKGVGSAEQFLLARRLMHNNIYFHIKANAVACCVIHLLNNLTKTQVSAKIQQTRLYEFLHAVDNNCAPKELYANYKQLVDFDIWLVIRDLALEPQDELCNTLARSLYYRTLPSAYKIKPSQLGTISQAVAKLQLPPWKIMVQTASLYSYKEHNSPIYICLKNAKQQLLHQDSVIIDKIANTEEIIAFLYVSNALAASEAATLADFCKTYALA